MTTTSATRRGDQKINPGDTGGKIPRGNFSVGITDARNSASTIDGGAPVYLGPANGLVVESPDAPTATPDFDRGDARREATPVALPSSRGAQRRSNPAAARDFWTASLRSR
jgi:hypothetical protein